MSKSLKSNVFFHLLGNVSSRIIPILFGLFVSRFWGNADYTRFVEMLILGNLVISFGTAGFIPQLMISNSNKVEKWNVFLISQTVVFLIIALVTLFNWEQNDTLTSLFLLFFSFGYGFLSTLSAILNSNNKYIEVSKVWVVNFFVFILFCSAAYYYKIDFFALLIGYSLVYFLSGIYLLLLVSKLKIVTIKLKKEIENNHVKSILKNAFYICGFAGFTLLGFKLIVNNISIQIDKQLFAFSYQLFSIVMFLPLIFGGIIIPYLSKSNNAEKDKGKSNKFLFFYLIISVAIVSVVLLLLSFLLKLYSFEPNEHSKTTLTVILISAIVGAVNTFYIHYFNSYKRYKVTFFAGVFWCLGIVLPLIYSGFNIKSSIFAAKLILVSYSISLIFLMTNRKFDFI